MKKIILLLSLLYSAAEAQNIKKMPNDYTEKITLGGGCYWCIEAVFQMLNGVVKVESGFSGGQVKNPSYKDVCAGTTGHAEVVQITFDNTKTSVEEILKVFFTVHDPTTLNRQGADEGTQYRSAIFYHNQNQYKIAKFLYEISVNLQSFYFFATLQSQHVIFFCIEHVL
jgi:methionine-S-sulfoxide reductase